MPSDIPTKVEIAMKIDGSQQLEAIKSRLNEIGIKNEKIQIVTEKNNKECRVVVETNSKPWIEIQETLQTFGEKRVALVGFSDQSAVAILDKGDDLNIKGVIRFCSISANKPGIVIDGVVDGIESPDDHFLSIYEYGDFSDGCHGLGNIYKDANYKLTSNDSGSSTIRSVDHNLNIHELIGRSVAISKANENIKFKGGIISRAAGIFQNWKKFCACDGTTLWDERDRQTAISGRNA
ncbi:CLUMA_CG018068, isoform A [Clunio marinus]|uniref:superoxide dismutase n=1 Tax=Clunio marinus TaxID=568069 RepID=A0A1J1IZQ6_9DIPT|nr:CLUMA_CG018068, isoform A [Clunio marinus]